MADSRTKRPQCGFYATFAGGVSATLSLLLAAPVSLFAQAVSPAAMPPIFAPKQLTPQQQVLHALNRLTFGPLPGQAATLSRPSLDAWFDGQLHPERIPDTALASRLAQFPAMELSQAELIERFPTPGMLRQYSRGNLEDPRDPVEHAIYTDAALSYEQKLNAGAGEDAGAAKPILSAAPQPDTDTMTPADLGGKRARAMPPMNEASAGAILALAPKQRLDHLLSLSPEDMQALRETLKGSREQQLVQGLTPGQAEQVIAMQAPIRLVGAEAMETRLLRDVYSERQLQAVMTDFWLNHFNVYLRKNQNEPYLLPAYERDTVLPHALGRFEDLLVATAKSPAMLVYLDNWTSVGPHSRAAERVRHFQTVAAAKGNGGAKGINENYARELMELHTLGVNGGYTQQDIIEVAKCFTGWTIAPPAEGGTFVFNPNRHEPGAKMVLGHKISEGGESEGLQVLHILATSPQTAHFLSEKLAQRFVSDNPPSTLVDRMAAAYMRHSGDISSVLSTLYHSPEFWSPTVYRAKVKTPLEFVASALRATEANVINPVPLVGALGRLGMPIYGMQTPNGYSWQSDAWVSSSALVSRMNLALVVSGDRLPGTQIDLTRLLGSRNDAEVRSSDGEERKLEQAILAEPAADRTRLAVLAQAKDPTTLGAAEANLKAGPATEDDGGAAMQPGLRRFQGPGRVAGPANQGASPTATMSGLLLGSPDFQRR